MLRPPHHKNWLIILVCLLLPTGLLAQRYHFHNLSVEDGLIQSQATCLAQDSIGNLWIGTGGGLSRFDGRNFTNYTVRNGLLNNIVRAVATDAHGNVWIGTSEGLSLFDGRNFTHYHRQPQAGRTTSAIQQLVVAGDTTWWRVQGDIYYVADEKMHYLATPDNSTVKAIAADRAGLWVGADSGLYTFKKGRWVLVPIVADTPPVIDHIFAGEGKVWLTSNGNL